MRCFAWLQTHSSRIWWSVSKRASIIPHRQRRPLQRHLLRAAQISRQRRHPATRQRRHHGRPIHPICPRSQCAATRHAFGAQPGFAIDRFDGRKARLGQNPPCGELSPAALSLRPKWYTPVGSAGAADWVAVRLLRYNSPIFATSKPIANGVLWRQIKSRKKLASRGSNFKPKGELRCSSFKKASPIEIS
jgi:hypothetical protein